MTALSLDEKRCISVEAPDEFLQLADAYRIYMVRHGVASAPDYVTAMLTALEGGQFFSYRFKGGSAPFRTPPGWWRAWQNETTKKSAVRGARFTNYGNNEIEGEYVKIADFYPLLAKGKPRRRGRVPKIDWDTFDFRAVEKNNAGILFQTFAEMAREIINEMENAGEKFPDVKTGAARISKLLGKTAGK